MGDGFSRGNVVSQPSSPYKAVETMIGYNFEGPFILQNPMDNFSPTSGKEVKWNKVISRHVSYLASVEVC
jgi:hypothetical protein